VLLLLLPGVLLPRLTMIWLLLALRLLQLQLWLHLGNCC
jgi:hypothetical protein